MTEQLIPIHNFEVREPMPSLEFMSVIPDATAVVYAEAVAELTGHSGAMLPKTVKEMLDLFEQQHSVVIRDLNGRFVSHAAATFKYPDSIEVGAVITSPNFRGRGAATMAIKELLTHLKKLYPESKIFALANEMSLPIFQRLGGVIIEPSELHQDVWSGCANCPRNPNKTGSNDPFHCCDTPIDLTHIVQPEGNSYEEISS